MNKGIALKVLGRGFYRGNDIVSLHRKKLKEKKRVYYSTSIRINEKMAPMIEELLLFNIEEDFFYSCHVVSAEVKREKWIPENAESYSPEPFKTVPERAWFLLDDIREIKNFDVFKELITNTKAEPLLPALQNSGRANAIYFRNRHLIENMEV